MAGGTETPQTPSPGADAASADVASALRELAERVGELHEELEALRSERRALPAVGPDAPGWDHRPALVAGGPSWARSLDSPAARRPTVPRFALEVAFLAAVAAGAAIARLEPAVIVAVLAVAWALVALIEWLAWQSDRRQEVLLESISLAGPRVEGNASWFAPPLEQTAELEETPVAAKLPPAEPPE